MVKNINSLKSVLRLADNQTTHIRFIFSATLCSALAFNLIGCSTIPSSPGQAQAGAGFSGHGLGDIHSHLFSIEGEIQNVAVTSGVVRFVTLKVIKPLPTALGYAPCKSGDVLVVHFDESISKLNRVRLSAEKIIRLQFGEIDYGENWGSNFNWIEIAKNKS